jgi:hypothetical protein
VSPQESAGGAPRIRGRHRQTVASTAKKPEVLVESLSEAALGISDLLCGNEPDLDHVVRLLNETPAGVPRESLAAVKLASGWWLVVLLDKKASEIQPARIVITIDSKGVIELAEWAEVRRRPDWRVTPDTVFVGEIWARWFDSGEPPPLDFEASTWQGTHDSDWDAENDWVLSWDGNSCSFNLLEAVLISDAQTQLRRGLWLDIQCQGSTGTGGEIGYTLTAAKDGMWVYLWGDENHYLGQIDPHNFNPVDAIVNCMGGGQMSGVAFVGSKVLGVMALREVVRHLETLDVSSDLSQIWVSGRGFERRANELLSGAS